jgi:SAM-dependent methyltransferase
MFEAVEACWICAGRELAPIHSDRFDFSAYREQDPELSEYTGLEFHLRRCASCGFAQPESLPALPRFFDRMYDQRWSEEWIENEFDCGVKDYIFRVTLDDLGREAKGGSRRLLDIGAHVGRLIWMASQAGWQAEGIELNPRTAAFASRRTGLPVHRVNAVELAARGREYDAVTLIDVLEHIPEPVRILETARRLLRRGGAIAVKVPCGPSQLLKERIRARLSPGYRVSVAGNLVHVNHFTPGSLKMALERAGFKDVRMTTGAPEVTPGVISRAVRLGVYHASRMVPFGVRTPLAMNLQARATAGGGI